MRKKERAVLAAAKLKERYPDAICSLTYNKDKPYELMMSTRLAAQCTDARVNIVTRTLYQKYQSLTDFANAAVEDLEQIVRPCGFYHMKARDLKEMARQLLEDYNGQLPDTLEELTKLSGIGRKTANLVLGDVFGKPAVVADTHCIRITGRLGLTTGTKDPHKAEIELRAILDPAESSDFCHRLVLFGREVCSARKPKCAECTLYDICKNPMDLRKPVSVNDM